MLELMSGNRRPSRSGSGTTGRSPVRARAGGTIAAG